MVLIIIIVFSALDFVDCRKGVLFFFLACLWISGLYTCCQNRLLVCLIFTGISVTLSGYWNWIWNGFFTYISILRELSEFFFMGGIFCIRAIKELYSCWGIVRRSMWAASCLASCCASCACAACTGVVGSISRRSARIAYCGLFALSLIVSWILRDFAGPLLAKIPCKFFLLCLS